MSGPNPVVIRLLAEQRKRCMATILSSAENSSWWDRLSTPQQQQFRDTVRSAISVFYDLTRDVVKVTEDDGVRNDIARDLIRAIHSQQREISAHLRPKNSAGDGNGGAAA